uniref:receptor protein-tyrosine kinase n=1 Tax=Romanomermis culicivorax TaxID=13658 RepID=A0A915KKY3_ROMCU
MRYKDKCVEKCPSLERYVPSKAQYEPNPDGTYSYNRVCVKQCPEHMSIYKEGCVSRCPENYYTANDSKICAKCNGNCEKVCTVNDTLTAANIKLFTNCTKLEGFLEITKQSFVAGNLTEKDLSTLSSVEEISEYVLIQSPGYLSHGLDFLKNLRKIEGRSGSFGLVVSNSELRYLGLVNLKHIANGEIYIGDNHDMCFLEKIPFEKIAKKTVMIHNRSVKTCEQEEKICDSLCDPKSGCWGPGPQNCFHCLRYKKGETCLDKCDVEKGLFDAGNWTCAQCHQECMTCNQS